MSETNEKSYDCMMTMSISDSAKYLGISRKTVYQLIEFGEIRVVKQGKATRVDKKSLDEFRNSGKSA
ncbi:MAG: helix-turn-helix domain-containing protein [Desulfatirhabdiaceae bacterium]